MISDSFRASAQRFLADVAEDFRANDADVIYGTVRLIERDEECFSLGTAELGVRHLTCTRCTRAKESRARRKRLRADRPRSRAWRKLFPHLSLRGRGESGSRTHPQFREFLRLKRQYDPTSVFESDWYRHHLALLDEDASARRPPGVRLVVSVLDVPVLKSVVPRVRGPVVEDGGVRERSSEIVRPRGAGRGRRGSS